MLSIGSAYFRNVRVNLKKVKGIFLKVIGQFLNMNNYALKCIKRLEQNYPHIYGYNLKSVPNVPDYIYISI